MNKIFLLVVLIVGLALYGCGGGGDDTGSDGNTPENSSSFESLKVFAKEGSAYEIWGGYQTTFDDHNTFYSFDQDADFELLLSATEGGTQEVTQNYPCYLIAVPELAEFDAIQLGRPETYLSVSMREIYTTGNYNYNFDLGVTGEEIQGEPDGLFGTIGLTSDSISGGGYKGYIFMLNPYFEDGTGSEDSTGNQEQSEDLKAFGPDQAVVVGDEVILPGECADPDWDVREHEWFFIVEPGTTSGATELLDADTPAPHFTAEYEGLYHLQHNCINGDGEMVSNWVRVLSTEEYTEFACFGGYDGAGTIEWGYGLYGYGVTPDAYGEELSYEWTILEKPVGSTTTLLEGQENFWISGYVTDLPGTYVFQLTVSDGANTCEHTHSTIVR